MQYEVLKIKKQFRYYADVIATPNKWYEKYLLFKKSRITQYRGVKGLWYDSNHKLAPTKITATIDKHYETQYEEHSGLTMLFSGLLSALLLQSFFKKPNDGK